MFDQLRADLRFAWRSLMRSPIVAIVVVMSLGVGIGVNTVVFSWIQAIVFRPIPGVADAASIYVVEPRTEAGLRPGASWREYLDLKERLSSLQELTAFRMVALNIGETSRNERTYALLVAGNYFSSLDLRPVLGRLLKPEDSSKAGAESVVVISYDYWQTRFGGAATALNQTLKVSDRELTIIGVTPEGFQGTVLGLQFDLWVPATMAPALLSGSRELDDRGLRGYSVMGRLRPSVSAEQAQDEASQAMRQLAQLYPESNSTFQADLVQFWRASRGPQEFLLQALTILQTVMLLLLLAVCGNTANLVLARASARQREIGVRLAVGAGFWRIVRLVFVENALMGILAAGVGAVIAAWGTNALRAVPLLTMQFPVRFQTSLDGAGLGFAIFLGLLCATLFGTGPALQVARVDPQSVLRSGSTSHSGGRLRYVLMAVEVALALIVLIAAGLFFKSFRQTQDTYPGFQREGLLLAAYDLGGRGVDGAGARLFASRLLDELNQLPDVERAAISSSVPFDIHGLPQRSFTLEGRARTDGALDRALSNTVTPGYFTAMRIALVAGSDFANLADTSAPAQAIVNEEFARRYVGDAEVLGRQVTIGQTKYVIIGIARNSLYESFSEPPTPIVYLSYRDRPLLQGEVHIRARRGDETLLAPAVRRAVRTIDPSLPIYNVRTMMQQVDMSLALRKIPARMFIVLGPLLLVLAAIGIYAVVAYSVANRTAEVGVRIALGATASRVVSQIVRENLRVIASGAVVGWLFVAFVYTHLMRGGLDLAVFIGAPLLLLGVSVFASWLPARRAADIDPMVALRGE